MKKRVLRMAALMLALLAAGGLKVSSDNAPRAALAEEDTAAYAADLPAIGSAEIWQTPYLDLVDALNSDCIRVSNVETSEGMFREIAIEDVPVSDYTADNAVFMYHGDALCTYSYFIKDDCNEESFEYLLQAMSEKYGSPMCKAFNFEKMSECAGYRSLDEYYISRVSALDVEMEWVETAVNAYIDLFLSTPEEVYEWNVGDHTRVSMFYCNANAFWGNDWCFIVYMNRQPHGGTMMLQEGERVYEYDVSGL